MQTDNLIALNEFCANHRIDTSFVNTLQHTGLIEITTIEKSMFIEANQLKQLEKIVQFHYELNINMEGIETITHLLHRITTLQDEMIVLQNRLRIYEPE